MTVLDVTRVGVTVKSVKMKVVKFLTHPLL